MTTIALREINRARKQRSRANPDIREREKQYRARNREAEHARNRARRRTKDGWLISALANARLRAKKRGMAFDIEADDLIFPNVCPVLGVPLVIGAGHNGRAIPDNPSLDRLDNSLGYVKGNVRIISLRANQLKSDATVEELRALVAYMENGGGL